MTPHYTILIIICFHGVQLLKSKDRNINVGIMVNGNASHQLLLETAQNINNNNSIIPDSNLILHFYQDRSITSLSRFSEVLEKDNISVILGEKFTAKQALFLSQFHQIPIFAVTDHPKENPDGYEYEYKQYNVMLPSNRVLAQWSKKILVSQKWKDLILLYTTEKSGELDQFLWACKDIAKHVIIPLEYKDGRLSNLTMGVIQKLALNVYNPDAYVLFAEPDEIKILIETVKNGDGLKGLFSNLVFFDPIQSGELVTDHETQVVGFKIWRNPNYIGDNAAYLAKEEENAAVFLSDALIYYAHLHDELRKEKASGYSNHLSSEDLYQKVVNKTKCQGVTGELSFDTSGHRKYIKIDIVHLQRHMFQKVGSADTDGRFILHSKLKHNFDQSMTQVNLGRPLKVVTLRSTPFLFRINENGTDKYYGLFIDMLNEMASMMNCTYEFYIVADKEYGREVNGRWTGMIGDVLYRKADIAIAALTVTSLRQKVVQFTRPYMNLEIVYVRKAVDTKGNQTVLFFQPFSMSVWLISAAIVILISLVLYVVDYYSPYGYHALAKEGGGQGRKLSLWNCVWFTATCTLQQGADRAPESLSGRIVTGFFWITALVTISSYTANLAAYLTFKKTMIDTTNLEGFLKLNYSFSVVKTSALDSFFQASDYYVYRLLYEKIVAENSFVTSSKYGVLNSRQRSDYIYIGEEPFVQKRLNSTPCDMVMVPGILPSMSFAFPVRKQSLLYHPVSNAIAKMLENGFIEKRKKYYFDETHKCSGKLSPPPAATTEDWRVGADSMSGVYMFLVAGGCASVLALIWEHWWKRQIEKKIESLASKVRVIGKTAMVVDHWKSAKKQSPRFSFSFNVGRKRSEPITADMNYMKRIENTTESHDNEDFKIEELD